MNCAKEAAAFSSYIARSARSSTDSGVSPGMIVVTPIAAFKADGYTIGDEDAPAVVAYGAGVSGNEHAQDAVRALGRIAPRLGQQATAAVGSDEPERFGQSDADHAVGERDRPSLIPERCVELLNRLRRGPRGEGALARPRSP